MKIVLTGGAGFIGANYAARLIAAGASVHIVDDLSRPGSRQNLAWIARSFGERSFEFSRADVRDAEAVRSLVADADAIVHLAAQVAVTSSIADPRRDFEVNALGTFNVLEGARRSGKRPRLLYTSTNKVYGGMHDLPVVERDSRYAYADPGFAIAEDRPLDFHSPYGCSKGAGDQYVRDYARIYGLRTLVWRQSCIYGQRQFGVEDQGWVAHFVIATVLGRPISIYGDGLQVRDVLHVDDLVAAYQLGIDRMDEFRGEVFNLGGGPDNTLAIWTEFGPLLAELAGRPVAVTYGPWRPGDQRVFVADIRRAAERLGWRPRVSPEQGIRRLYAWVAANPELF